MAKHRYLICINGGTKEKPQLYNFGQTKGIALSIGRQKAVIEFSMGVKKTQEELTSFSVKVFRDAYRKAYLIHAIQYQEGLEVKKLSIAVDGEECIYDSQAPNFPFLFSMVGKKLELDPAWEGMSGAILHTTKTKQDEDLRFSAAYSYLAGLKRKFEIDRFTNFWTSMNAYYTYRGHCYKKYLMEVYGAGKDEADKLCISTESQLIGSLAWKFDGQYRGLSKKESDKLWSHFYDTERELGKLGEGDRGRLYREALEALAGDKELPEAYEKLGQCASRFGVSLFSYLLLIYPYHLRCKFLHGDRSTLLVAAYNDYEINVLRAVNYFLWRFLDREIPKMFREDFWTGKEQEEMEKYIRNLEDQGKLNIKHFSSTLEQLKNRKGE